MFYFQDKNIQRLPAAEKRADSIHSKPELPIPPRLPITSIHGKSARTGGMRGYKRLFKKTSPLHNTRCERRIVRAAAGEKIHHLRIRRAGSPEARTPQDQEFNVVEPGRPLRYREDEDRRQLQKRLRSFESRLGLWNTLGGFRVSR